MKKKKDILYRIGNLKFNPNWVLYFAVIVGVLIIVISYIQDIGFQPEDEICVLETDIEAQYCVLNPTDLERCYCEQWDVEEYYDTSDCGVSDGIEFTDKDKGIYTIISTGGCHYPDGSCAKDCGGSIGYNRNQANCLIINPRTSDIKCISWRDMTAEKKELKRCQQIVKDNIIEEVANNGF